MTRAKLALAAMGAVLAASPAAAQNLVSNGSFETGSFSGWTVNLGPNPQGVAPVVIPYNSSATYPGGAYGEPIPVDNAIGSRSPDAAGGFTAYFSSDTANPNSISQTVNLVAGNPYYLGFDYYVPLNGYNNPNDATLSFLLNGAPVGSTLTAGSVTGTTPAQWFNFTTSFVAATTGAQTLTFQFRGGGVTAADFAIDRVYATSAVPEPASWALMIGGFGLVGGAMRRRRAAQPALA